MHRFPEALGALIVKGNITVRTGAIAFTNISKGCPNKVLGCLWGFIYLLIIPTYIQFCSCYQTIHLLEPPLHCVSYPITSKVSGWQEKNEQKTPPNQCHKTPKCKESFLTKLHIERQSFTQVKSHCSQSPTNIPSKKPPTNIPSKKPSLPAPSTLRRILRANSLFLGRVNTQLPA